MSEYLYYWLVIASYAVLFLMHTCLYFIERKKYILMWSCSWLFFILSYLVYFQKLTTNHYILFSLLESIIAVLALWAVANGSVAFFCGKSSRFISIISLFTITYYIVISFMKLPDNFYFIPRLILGGVLLTYTGILSIHKAYIHNAIRHMLGIFFIVWGMGNILFIFGFIFSQTLFFISLTLIGSFSTLATLSLQIAYFQHCRENKETMDEKIQHLVIYDKLTGIYNRGYCEIEMEGIDTEENLPTSIILGDLNALKLINDTFGHNKGDELISEAANIIKSAAPEYITGRWGGDEFIIVLPKTSLQRAKKIAQKIKKMCGQFNGTDSILDISLGAASKERPEQSLSEIIKAADSMLYRNKLAESRIIRKTIVDYLKNLLLEKNIETEEHVLRMREMARLVAQEIKLSSKEEEDLALAAFLHDIGKISIPDHILKKPGKLTPDEMKIMKTHSEASYRITLSSGEFAHISQPVLYHHERWDGKGYPQGLKGENIPLAARIISIIDAYDAMTHARIYKDPIPCEDALKEIERCAGTQFDPFISKLFVKLMKKTKLQVS